MIESQNQPGVYYLLPGELVLVGRVPQTFETPGWYYAHETTRGRTYDGPYPREADAVYAARQHTEARQYKDRRK